jgi:hypothetical protein
MISSFLDSFVFACPNEPSEDDIVALIASLIEWRDLEQAQWMRAFVSTQVGDVLVKAGCGFPPWKSVSDSILHAELDLTPRDVHSLIEGLMTRLPKIEEELNINDVFVDSIDCQPNFAENRSPVFKEDFSRLLALISLFRQRCCTNGDDQLVVLSRELPACPTVVVFSATLQLVDPDDAVAVPQQLALTAPVFECQRHHADTIDPFTIWTEAVTTDQLRAAIRIYSGRTAHISNLEPPANWTLGPQFSSSIISKHLTTRSAAQMILRACAETILGQNLTDVHPIRESKAADAAQVHRGQDTAWRRDISRELHLHYWNTHRGIEFSKVVMHKDTSIA